MKIALYARVSKAGDQTTENQLLKLRAWAKQHPEYETKEFVEEESSRKTRPVKELVLKQLRAGDLRGVCFYSMDRWGRSLRELVLEFEEAQNRNWVFVSLREGIDLTNATGRLHAHVLSAFAEFEREAISERTKAGLERAKAQGKKLGRPRVPDPVRYAIYRMNEVGMTASDIVLGLKTERFGMNIGYRMSESGVRKILKEVRNEMS